MKTRGIGLGKGYIYISHKCMYMCSKRHPCTRTFIALFIIALIETEQIYLSNMIDKCMNN